MMLWLAAHQNVLFWCRSIQSLEHRADGEAMPTAFHRHHHHHRVQVKMLSQRAIWRLNLHYTLVTSHNLHAPWLILVVLVTSQKHTALHDANKITGGANPTWEVYPSRWCDETRWDSVIGQHCFWRSEGHPLDFRAVFAWWIRSQSDSIWS